MRFLYLISVWIHLIAAAAWIGGMLFLVLVVVPALTSEPPARRTAILTRAALRFRTLGWIALAGLALTGTFNLYYRGLLSAQLLSVDFVATPYGAVVWLKLGLFLVAVLLSAYHDFSVGPRAARLLSESPHSAVAQRARRTASWMGRANLLIALCIVALAVSLVRGCSW